MTEQATQDSNAERTQRSIEAFQARHPDVWARIESALPAASSLIDGDDGPENIDLGTAMLYQKPARTWTREQLDDFSHTRERIYFTDPNHCNITPLSLELAKRQTEFLRERNWTSKVAGLPVVDVGYLLVLGVGLGYHVPDLVRSGEFRHVVLIEPFPEFFAHSCHAIDWQDVFDAAEERGITLHFVIERDPQDMSRRVEEIIVNEGNTFLDGTSFFSHYYSWGLEQAFIHMKERLKHLYISNGFFEDELAMVRNTHENLKACSFSLLEGRPYLQQKLPVFLVGSGPSLDKDMAYIRKWRDQVIVFSCGTALRILLSNGIRPDLHCENERVELVTELINECATDYGLEGITLVATTTMYPEVAKQFDRRWFYFRHGLSPATLLNAGRRPLFNADPLVCNAAFSAITFLGFENIYLFGMDLGQKEGAGHHAKDAAYNDDKRSHLNTLYEKRFEEARIVPGNFGGKVKTFWAFDMGRRMLGEVQRVRGIKLYNCSDGARIANTRPQKAAGIKLTSTAGDGERVLRQVAGEMHYFEAGQILAEIDLETHINAFDQLRDEISDLLKKLRADNAGFWEINEAIKALHSDPEKAYGGCFSLIRSSMRSMIRLGAFFGNRIADVEARQAYIDHFLTGYEERCMTMISVAQDLLSEIEADRGRYLADHATPQA